MKIKKSVYIMLALIFITVSMPPVIFAEDGNGEYFEDFSGFKTGELTDTEGIYSYNANSVGTVTVTDYKVVRITKSGNTAAITLNAELSPAINPSITDYAVSFKLKEALTNAQSFNINMAACISFKKVSSGSRECALQYYDSDTQGWVTTDKYYNVSEGCTIKFVIKSRSTVDLYIDGSPVLRDLKQRGSYSYTKLQIIVNKSAYGIIDIDDVSVTPMPVIPEYAEYNGTEASLKVSEDFCDFTTGYLADGTGGIGVSKDNMESGSYVRIENTNGNNFVKIIKDKTVADGGTAVGLSRHYGGAASGMDSYTVSFNIILSGKESYNISCGGVYISVNASTKAIRYYNGSWIAADTPVSLNAFGWSRVTYTITPKSGKNYADIYVNDILLARDVPQRYSEADSILQFDTNNSTVGSLGVDEIFVREYNGEKIDKTITPPGTALNTESVPEEYIPGESADDFDLYLAIGQSNMAGRADIEIYDRYTLPNTYLFNSDNKWETAQVQYINNKWYGLNRYSNVADSAKYQGLNSLVEFSGVIAPYAEERGRAVGIISNARGETSIEQWLKGYEGGTKEDYDLYEKTVARTKDAMKYGNLKAILWHQGCADTAKTDYMEKLGQLMSDLRADLGADVPVIIGEIPGYGADSSSSTRRINFNINNIQKADSILNCRWISSAGNKDKGDNTHFDSESQRDMGRKYAREVLENVYGISFDKTVFSPDTAVCGGSDASVMCDGKKSIGGINDNSTYMSVPAGSSYIASFDEKHSIDEINIYFRDPWNVTYMYEVFARADGEWISVADNKGDLRYGETTVDGGVAVSFDNVLTDSIRIDFLGARNYDGSLVYKDNPTVDCHEIVILGNADPITFDNKISGNILTSKAVINGIDNHVLILEGVKDNGLLVRIGVFAENTAQMNIDGVDKIKIFAWKDLEGLTPVSECYEREISEIPAAE